MRTSFLSHLCLICLLTPGCIELPTSGAKILPVGRPDMARAPEMGGADACGPDRERVEGRCLLRCVRGETFCGEQPSLIAPASDAQGQESTAESFGMAVAVFPDGDWLTVSAPFDVFVNSNQTPGFVVVYPRLGSQDAGPQVLIPEPGWGACGFGSALSVTESEGAVLLDVGAPCSPPAGGVGSYRCAPACRLPQWQEIQEAGDLGVRVARVGGGSLYASTSKLYGDLGGEAPYTIEGHGQSMVTAPLGPAGEGAEWVVGMHLSEPGSEGWHVIYAKAKGPLGPETFTLARRARLAQASGEFATPYGADLSGGGGGQMAMLSGPKDDVTLTLAFGLLEALERSKRNAAALIDGVKRISVRTGFVASEPGVTQVRIDQGGNVWVLGQEPESQEMAFHVYALREVEGLPPELVRIKRVGLPGVAPRVLASGAVYMPRFVLVGFDASRAIAAKVFVSGAQPLANSGRLEGRVRRYCVTLPCDDAL